MDSWRSARRFIDLSRKYGGHITGLTSVCRWKRGGLWHDFANLCLQQKVLKFVSEFTVLRPSPTSTCFSKLTGNLPTFGLGFSCCESHHYTGNAFQQDPIVFRPEDTFRLIKSNSSYDRAKDGARYKMTRLLWASVLPFLKKKEEEEDQIVSLLKHATLAEQQENLGRANFLYHEALKQLNRRLKEKEIEAEEYRLIFAQITSMLANVDMRLSHWDDAEQLFKASMRACLEAGISQDSNAIVEMSLKLAQIYHNQGKEDLAVHGVEFCIATMEKKVIEEAESDEDTLALWGLVLNSYGQLLIGLRRTISNCSREDDGPANPCSETEDLDNGGEEENDGRGAASSACITPPLSRGKKRSAKEDITAVVSSYLQDKQRRKESDVNKDEDVLFMLSHVQSLKRLPARKKAQVKFQIHQVLYQAEYGSDLQHEQSVAPAEASTMSTASYSNMASGSGYNCSPQDFTCNNGAYY